MSNEKPLPTTATIDWSKVIINERPEGMTFEDYKLHQKAYRYLLRLRKSQGIEIRATVYPVKNEDPGRSEVV